MATVKENLIAAKALIDTPEKFSKLSADAAIDKVTGRKTAANKACVQAIRNSRGMTGTDWSCHREVIDRFDRAIAAQEPQNGEK